MPVELTAEILGEAGYRVGWIKANVTYPFLYVHQLQNLHHALTGEELKIELPTTGKEE